MSYTHLTERERYVISHLHCSGYSVREISRRLQRAHTTISREVQRNGSLHARYWYTFSQPKADARRCRAKPGKRETNQRLMRYILRKLKQEWSPEQIAHRIQLDYPNDLSMRISHEGLYKLIYRDGKGGGKLYLQLRRCRKKRRKQARYGTGRGLIADRKRIAERPDCVDARARFGDWEGDTVIGKQGTGAIVTHVERKSRYLLTAKLVDKQSKPLTDVTIKLFKGVKPHLRKTLTVDNGKEFSTFKQIERKTNLAIYFADPYSSWQRGCNENSNGLLRQYFPKGLDFTTITEKQLAQATRRINNRPRKCLGYQTPSEVFWSASSGALTS